MGPIPACEQIGGVFGVWVPRHAGWVNFRPGGLSRPGLTSGGALDQPTQHLPMYLCT